MSGITYDYMESYLRSLIKDETGLLLELEEYAKENHVPIIQKEGAQFLRTLVTLKKPKKILELGTAIGYSALLMYESSSKETVIDTIERDEEMINLARENIKKAEAESNIHVLEGDVLEIIKDLEGKYDMIFLDAGKGHYNHLLPEMLRLLSDDGIIIADNVLFRGMVANDELVKRRKITIVKRMREYLLMVSELDNFYTTVIPMGDGIALTVRRSKA